MLVIRYLKQLSDVLTLQVNELTKQQPLVGTTQARRLLCFQSQWAFVDGVLKFATECADTVRDDTASVQSPSECHSALQPVVSAPQTSSALPRPKEVDADGDVSMYAVTHKQTEKDTNIDKPRRAPTTAEQHAEPTQKQIGKSQGESAARRLLGMLKSPPVTLPSAPSRITALAPGVQLTAASASSKDPALLVRPQVTTPSAAASAQTAATQPTVAKPRRTVSTGSASRSHSGTLPSIVSPVKSPSTAAQSTQGLNDSVCWD